MHEQLLRRSEVQERTQLSKNVIYRLMREGKFPRSLRLSHRVAVWREAEIDGWIENAPRYEYKPRNVTRKNEAPEE